MVSLMGRAGLIPSSPIKGLLQGPSRGLLTQARATGPLALRDTLWACKDVCSMASRCHHMDSRDQGVMCSRGSSPITASTVRGLTRASSSRHTPGLPLGNQEVRDLTHLHSNLMAPSQLAHMDRLALLINNPTCPSSHRGR